MDLWNDLSKTICNAADHTVKGAEKLTGVAKLKYKISAVKSKLQLYFRSIGELKYSEYNGEEVTDDMYKELFEQTEKIKAELDSLEKQLADLQNCITCPQCGYRAHKDMSFCPKCGEKLQEQNK